MQVTAISPGWKVPSAPDTFATGSEGLSCCSQADSATTDAIASATREEQARIRSFMAASLCTVGQRKFRSILNEVGVRANTSVTSITSFVPMRADGIYLLETNGSLRTRLKKNARAPSRDR